MGRGFFLSLLGGLFLIASSYAENTLKNHEEKKDIEPPKDNTNLSNNERRKILLENLLFVDKKFQDLPDADKRKPIARTENEAVEAAVEKKVIAEQRNRRGQDVAFIASEVTSFSAVDAQKAIKEVIKDNLLTDDFVKYTEQYDNLKEAVTALDNAGGLKVNKEREVTTQQTAALVLEKDPARIVYLAAAYKFHKDMMNATEPRADASAVAQQSIQNSGAALGSSFNSGRNNSSTLPQSALAMPDLASIAGGYLDIAAKQIVNAGNNRPTENGSLAQSSPLRGGTELNKLFENALNAANRLDLSNKGISDELRPFKDLINSKAFLENGALLLGKDNADTLVSSVQAAELLNAAEGKVTDTAASYLSGAFNLGTGLASPPCIGCVEIKNSPLLKAAEEFRPLDEKVNEEAQKWLDEAKEISDQANKNRSLGPKQISALIKGRSELDKLIQTLELYKSLGVLNLVEIPSNYSMSRRYKEAAELAAAVLFDVRQKKHKRTQFYVVRLNHKKLKSSASNLLEKLKRAKNPASIEQALRGFFEKDEHEESRNLWREYEMANYKKLRSLTAQIIMSRAMSALRIPSFEKLTLERASLGYLVNRAFSSMREREEKLLKERQRNLGILNLPGIKMADEKLKGKDKSAQETKPDRYPTFSEE